MFDSALYASLGLEAIHEKTLAGERLSYDDGMVLFKCEDLTAIGALAAHARFQRHGARTYYVVNRQINYTNICVNDCAFCAFHRERNNQPGAFLLSHEEILGRIEKAANADIGLDELHMVGGCHPDLKLGWFEELLDKVVSAFPDLPIKAFTPVEIAHFARMEGIPTKEVLARLHARGLKMLPGGGAEIFNPELRKKICPRKATGDEWLKISGEAHNSGLNTNCTMLFGHLETWEQRVEHLLMLRAQQDATGGFTCFIPLPFLKHNSLLRLPRERMSPAEGLDQLRTIAVARLLLDNIPHIKAYWIMLGIKLAQAALWYGADDLDGTIVEERIGHMAGARSDQGMTISELEFMICESGFQPVRRDALFREVEERAQSC